MTVEQPEDVTIGDSVSVVTDHSGETTIEDPVQVTITGDPTVVMDHPATVTVRDQKQVLVEESDDLPRRMVPIDAADGSRPFVVPRPGTVSSTEISRVTIE